VWSPMRLTRPGAAPLASGGRWKSVAKLGAAEMATLELRSAIEAHVDGL